jgi:hypothetical protein
MLPCLELQLDGRVLISKLLWGFMVEETIGFFVKNGFIRKACAHELSCSRKINYERK